MENINVVILGLLLTLLVGLSAYFLQTSKKYSNLSFTMYILAGVASSMFFPNIWVVWGTFETKQLIVPLLQMIMFGMGTTIGIGDFYGVMKMPKAVLLGLLCQFTIMPLVGYGLGFSFGFPSEIAAGIILIGSCPGGLASNVMAYLAKANVALSITLTTIATLLAPFVTPLLMQLLAGAMIPIDAWGMMGSIFKMVILPVCLGLFFHHLNLRVTKKLLVWMPKVSMGAILLIIIIITANGRDALLSIGLLLIFVAIIHNLVGYFLGYWGSKVLGFPEKDCRTIAFEVGMQNGGLASGIAVELGRVGTLGLAPALFGPWMNISGSTLALWWKEKN